MGYAIQCNVWLVGGIAPVESYHLDRFERREGAAAKIFEVQSVLFDLSNPGAFMPLEGTSIRLDHVVRIDFKITEEDA